jgi:sensor histidine kinase YesM
MASFIENKLIFSDERKYRISRHLLFWSCYWIYFGFLHAANSFGAPEIMFFNNLPYTITESLLLTIPQLVIAYPMLYFILPKYFLQKKYVTGFFFALVVWMCAGLITFFMVGNINQRVLEFLMPVRFLRIPQRAPNTTFFMGLLIVMKGGMLGTTTAIGVKLMKHWYVKEHRNMLLQKENAAAQMQLLTAQIHPHFLFNTLNNIFSQTQTESPKGSKMIMGLSDMLRYILYEGQKPLVPLEQELMMVTEYINLEKIRYGNKLDVHVLIPDKATNLFIAPLLLLPFIENCFKHGASNMLENPWINFTVEIRDSILVMKLMNGKAPVTTNENGYGKTGIGISNVRQRLELLYKNNYDLQVREDDEVFVVDLRLELIKIDNKDQAEALAQIKSELTYA